MHSHSRTSLPPYLRQEQERIEAIAHAAGLDFFPVIFEMLSYDQINEIAAYGGFPNRYPHWRFGMDYERLSKSNEYGLSKIYELVMCHVYGHVDFFKNNFAFRSTDLNATGKVINPVLQGEHYRPNRKWVDRIANHGATVRRIIDRQGIDEVEKFIDNCLSLENLIDPYSPFMVRSESPKEEEEPRPVEVPRLKAKSYMDKFINPEEYIQEQKAALEAKQKEKKN